MYSANGRDRIRTLEEMPMRRFCWKATLAVTMLAGLGSSVQAQTFTNLADFNFSDGADPRAGLVQGVDGNFYGETYSGGANTYQYCDSNCGTIFRITDSGTLTTL